MPLLSSSDQNFDTLSDQSFDWLIAEYVLPLLENNFRVLLGMPLQLRKRLICCFAITLYLRLAFRPVIKAHDPHELLCPNVVAIR